VRIPTALKKNVLLNKLLLWLDRSHTAITADVSR